LLTVAESKDLFVQRDLIICPESRINRNINLPRLETNISYAGTVYRIEE
jgi:hypothetical protein